MAEFQEDAYVERLPGDLPAWMGTHCVVIDLIQTDGEVVHKVLTAADGEENAIADAAALNQWRDQMNFDK